MTRLRAPKPVRHRPLTARSLQLSWAGFLGFGAVMLFTAFGCGVLLSFVVPDAQAASLLASPTPTLTATATATASPSATATQPPPTGTPTPTPSLTPTATPSPAPTQAVDAQIDVWLAAMTLEEKVGQMLMPGISGTTLDDATQRRIVDYHVGGFWLTTRNIESAAQVATLTQSLAAEAAASSPGIPLFISIDHEGGGIHRFPADPAITHFPSPREFAATAPPEDAYTMGLTHARELQAIGINMNLAPVLDLELDPGNTVIGARSFGSDPGIVSAFGVAYWQGLFEGGLIGVAKHFPGHGRTAVDSHYNLPVVNVDRETLNAVDTAPFRAVIDAGIPAIMVGHLQVPVLDPERPASLSSAVVDGYLRGELGFAGVVLADDLSMGAIKNSWAPTTAAVRAVQAGVDLFPLSSPAQADSIYEALLQAVHDGVLTEERIDVSVRRILALKLAYGLTPPAPQSHVNPREVSASEGAACVLHPFAASEPVKQPISPAGMPAAVVRYRDEAHLLFDRERLHCAYVWSKPDLKPIGPTGERIRRSEPNRRARRGSGTPR